MNIIYFNICDRIKRDLYFNVNKFIDDPIEFASTSEPIIKNRILTNVRGFESRKIRLTFLKPRV